MRMTQKELDQLLKCGNVKVSNQHPGQAKTKRPGKTKDEFQSKAEETYFLSYIHPLMLVGEIVECDLHKSFEIIPPVKWGNVSLRSKMYTPDFFLRYKDGTIKVVEIKGKVVRKLQRDYTLRRQLFILNYCIPNQWEFEEVEAESLTGK